MADEDDRYGPPTHSCKYCNKCFPATLEKNRFGEKCLKSDLLLDGADALVAALDGCQFLLLALHPHKSDAETTRAAKFSKASIQPSKHLEIPVSGWNQGSSKVNVWLPQTSIAFAVVFSLSG
ncbi:hypothetical protein HBI56_206750 [Parastagonospora nodorum]|uniref:Uncharacterized protein n=1 Tax=Phaeosphaeria nodorum (strain SN15 / ATCC MYA-4574 / FGSC 10173) TaxID=321614 RepID=Q0TYF6_PHANO|nr:hypothetical protein SNOG_15501 [Parastagonospora nodorum SN15]KAH3905476.1 hypothetical protein HBH56_218250 [Parastagonospora nodorum]EAT77166.1 hypothetical protein SNOG_15501 [Parastagonospora nodorum SN15]KAH3922734.1 hypothetical protein HBH54_220110 [Parastagonospora nodorum]KAH3958137.1 hypothetical protein HBH51_213780 [Parastagonospora nodorum]KAH3961447.1 hypothetical protein HBH52_230960 [Parastagonospora nodorum]